MTQSTPTAAPAKAGAKPRNARTSIVPSRPRAAAPVRKELPAKQATPKLPDAPKARGRAAAAPPKVTPVLAAEAPGNDHPKARAKLVRDSFTMPQQDFDLIATLKERALGFKRPTKKSELLRAGLQVLAGLRPDELKAVLGRLVPLKTGRPKKAG